MWRFVMLAVIGLAGMPVAAVQPESGWWWNQNESGRGFSIEVQNHTMFFAGYLYEANGNAVWYASAGTYDHNASRFSAPLLAFTGGQCLTCPYRPNVPAPSPGNLTMTFTSPTTGTLTWPGGSIPITRFLYGTTSDYKRLAGRWAYTNVTGSLTDGDWVNFDQTTVSNGNNFVAGQNNGGRVAVGAVLSGSYSVLIDSSTSFYDLYLCPPADAGLEHLTRCRSWLYEKTSSPTGSGKDAQAFKYGPAPAAIATAAPEGDKAAHAQALAAELARVTPAAMREAGFAEK